MLNMLVYVAIVVGTVFFFVTVKEKSGVDFKVKFTEKQFKLFVKNIGEGKLITG